MFTLVGADFIHEPGSLQEVGVLQKNRRQRPPVICVHDLMKPVLAQSKRVVTPERPVLTGQRQQFARGGVAGLGHEPRRGKIFIRSDDAADGAIALPAQKRGQRAVGFDHLRFELRRTTSSKWIFASPRSRAKPSLPGVGTTQARMFVPVRRSSSIWECHTRGDVVFVGVADNVMALLSISCSSLQTLPGSEIRLCPSGGADNSPVASAGASTQTNSRCIPKKLRFTNSVERRNSLSGSNASVQLSCTTKRRRPSGVSATTMTAPATTSQRQRTTKLPEFAKKVASRESVAFFSGRRRESSQAGGINDSIAGTMGSE